LILLDRLLLRRVLRDEVGDAVSLCIGSKSAQDFILGNSLPSLSGLDRFLEPTQHRALGYCRPSLSGLVALFPPAIVCTLGTIVLPSKTQHRTVEKTNLDKFESDQPLVSDGGTVSIRAKQRRA
jgi:hypothetical protein